MFWNSPPFPFVRHLEANADVIREEAEQLALSDYDDWPDPEAFQGGWKVFGLLSRDPTQPLAETCTGNKERCPRSVKILERVPGLLRAGFSLLMPGTHIYRHADQFEDRLRCHLPLITNPGAGIRFDAGDFLWKLGSCLVFDGHAFHEAANLGEEPRVICLIDLERDCAEKELVPDQG